MTRTVLLVRHTEVAHRWHKRCYGVSDAGLSRNGQAHLRALVLDLAGYGPDHIVHSGLRRAAALAAAVGDVARREPAVDHRWRECHFGDWEGLLWSAIYRASGNAMDGMITAPGSFRPGGGETTFELTDRATAALAALPNGRTLVVAHGGSIAALLGRRAALPVASWFDLVPVLGGRVEIVDGARLPA